MAKARELQAQEAARLEELVNAVDLIQVRVFKTHTSTNLCMCAGCVAGRSRVCPIVGRRPCVCGLLREGCTQSLWTGAQSNALTMFLAGH